MIGVIAQINIDNNSAIVVDTNKKQYPFSLDECIGFDSLPIIGEKVEFDLHEDEIFFVKSIHKKEDSNNSQSEVQSTNKKFHNKHMDIPIDKNVENCLEYYFEEIISVVYKYEAEFKEGELLDFVMMKRFLNTAYNNLKDMDSTFMDEYLLELRSDLKILEDVYLKFHKKNYTPEMAYDSIFLEQQSTYQSYKQRVQTNLSTFYALQSTVNGLEQKIKNIQNEIENLSSKKVIELRLNDLKRYKGYYVDSIHDSATLKSENIKLKKALNEFEIKFKNTFILEYTKIAKDYDDFLVKQLNGYAYEFDKKMWESAEKSTAIRAFFKRANIEEEFSSKTFLKYFIKSLDSTKFSQEHKRLNELLEYLDSRAKMRILIVSEDIVEADYIKHLVRSFDKEYSVEKSDKPRSTYYRKDLIQLDIIFVNYGIKNPTIMEFVDMLQKRLQQSKSKALLCITANTLTKEALVHLKQKNINNFLVTSLDNTDLQLHVKQIIESIND